MSTSPPPPQLEATETSSTEDAYIQLIGTLHPRQPSILEIDILPSTYSPRILSDPPALALPKSLLAKLFLLAQRTFFDPRLQTTLNGDEGYDARLKATSIIILFDPSHVTAANFRKRHILQCSMHRAGPSPRDVAPSADIQLQAHALHEELSFLTSLLTSPLHKHAKSSTLWAQRCWIFQHFLDVVIVMDGTETEIPQTARALWSRELSIVMKAGERHPRNYYAWNYARQLFSIVQSIVKPIRRYQDLLSDTMREVHRWCLMHPRDISGWAFLVFWLGKVRDQGGWWKQHHLQSGDSISKGGIGRVVTKTKAWVTKYDWKGKSVEWFLEAVKELDLVE